MTQKTEPKAGGQGQAGRAETRSDLTAHVEIRKSGGTKVQVRSKVAAYYGESIRRQAEETLAALGVRHAVLTLDDQGAFPFAIAARIETAIRRAGSGSDARALPPRRDLPPPSPKDRLRRSRLYLPGSEARLFVNARLHEPDAVILDLEDSVHPAEKDAARVLVRNALRAVDFGGCERMVRINQLPLGFEDLEEIVPQSPDLILIPKAETPDQVARVADRIEAIRNREGNDRPVWVMPILESALGIENAFSLASASPLVAALTIGLEDYTADLGVAKTPEGSETLYARSRLVNAAKAARIQAIDSVYGDVEDAEGLRQWARRSRALGFEGMGCIHPRQIPVVHEAFAPARDEVEKARRIVAAFREAEARGLGVVSLGSKMIDPPVVDRARKLVERARAMGLLNDEP